MNASDCDSSQGYALDDFENDDSSDDGIENGTKDINVSSLAFNVSSLAIDIGDKDGGEASLSTSLFLPQSSSSVRSSSEGKVTVNTNTTDDPKSERTYNYDRRTRQTSWSGEWKDSFDPKSERTYYYNRRTRQTSWSLPDGATLFHRPKKKENKQVPVVEKERNGGDETVETAQTSFAEMEATNEQTTASPRRRLDLSKACLLATSEKVSCSVPSVPEKVTAQCLPPKQDQPPQETAGTLFCVYCASPCATPDCLSDHLLVCEAYMNLLSKHCGVQKALEDCLLLTWGVKRPPVCSDKVAGARNTCDQATPLVQEVSSSLAIASTSASASASTFGMDRSEDEDFRPGQSRSCPLSRPLTSPGFAGWFEDESTILLDPHQESSGGHDELAMGLAQSPTASLRSFCPFCDRTFAKGDQLSRHLLRCRRRQRTRDRRRARPRDGERAKIPILLSGGRSLPGHPIVEGKGSRPDSLRCYGRRLEY